MDVLQKFQKEFIELIDITYDTYWDLPSCPKKTFSLALQDTLIKTLEGKDRVFDLTKEDLKQQLSMFWLIYYKQYQTSKPKVSASLRSYIIRRSIWDIRDWIKRNTNIITTEYYIEEEFDPPEFKIDLSFLLEGTDMDFLKNLSPYERYLIFLRFKEDKSILQMSYVLQKDRRVVKDHFNLIIDKLKENYINGQKDTREYSSRIDGIYPGTNYN